MVALFSTLLNSTANESSSSSIPTVIQLYASSTPLLLQQENKKLAGHAILSYQAVKVNAASASAADDSTLFGRARKNNPSSNSSNIVEMPNLGVWNAKVLATSTTNTNSNALVDSLLKIPSSPYYCLTIPLVTPSQVEPEMTRMQEALVRYLIACPPPTNTSGNSTSLYQLRDVQFGLAPEDTPPATTAAPDESDRNVLVNIMICAAVPSQTNSTNYQETQAQNLVTYHLRRFAAAIGATLVFVSSGSNLDKNNAAPEDTEETDESKQQATLTLNQLGNVWREFAQAKDVTPFANNSNEEDSTQQTANTAIYGPNQQDEQELIETVLLRNANNPPAWDSSKDSLWKALPPSNANDGSPENKTSTSTGDNAWMQQLRDSLGTAVEPAATASTPATPKTDDAEVSSFFENLLKK